MLFTISDKLNLHSKAAYEDPKDVCGQWEPKNKNKNFHSERIQINICKPFVIAILGCRRAQRLKPAVHNGLLNSSWSVQRAMKSKISDKRAREIASRSSRVQKALLFCRLPFTAGFCCSFSVKLLRRLREFLPDDSCFAHFAMHIVAIQRKCNYMCDFIVFMWLTKVNEQIIYGVGQWL